MKIGIPEDFKVHKKSYFSMLSSGWALRMMNIDKAHAVGNKGKGVTIAVLDSGHNFEHDDLPEPIKLLKGKNFESVQDENGHGSHVCNIAYTIAPESKYIIGRLLNANGIVEDPKDISEQIIESVDAGARVINLSLGASHKYSNPHIDAAIEYAYARGVVIVAASGNEGAEKVGYPANHDLVLAIGAIDHNGVTASFQNKGFTLDFVGPGVNILSAWLGKDNRYASGTSQATPHIAALIALIIASYLERTGVYPSIKEIIHLLKLNSKDLGAVGFDQETGFGLPTATEQGIFLTDGEITERPAKKDGWFAKLICFITRL